MKYLLSLIVLILFAMSLSSYAESDFATGDNRLSSSASINFVIKIPQAMYMRVGIADELAPKELAVPPNGQLSARVVGNTGTILLSASGNTQAKMQTIQVVKNADVTVSHPVASPVVYTATMP